MSTTFTITYQFTLPDKNKERFDLVFDAKTIELVRQIPDQSPSWTRLDYQQCPHCPLSVESHPYCPVALNLVTAIERFDRLMSFDKVYVEVISAERNVVHHTSAQEGLSSLMGLMIAGSSCPLTHFFKPMARFHLPFANKNETIWRAAATYLLAHYLIGKKFQATDLDIKGLAKIYDDVTRLNDAVVERLRAATSKDSAVNALVHLDVFAKFLMPPLEDSLDHIKPVLEPFLSTNR